MLSTPMPFGFANFYRNTRDARKVIVVDLGFLGDTVHLAPALWELDRHYPQAELHVLTTPVGCEVLRLVPCVDRGWALEMDPAKRTLRQQWEVLRALRRERFEVAYNFSGADRTIFMTALTGARWRMGYAAARRHFWNGWLIANWVAPQRRDIPVFEQRRQALAACGLEPAPAHFGLEPPAAARDWARAELPGNAIHLSLNASTPLKEWPLEHWIVLARRLLEQRPDLRLVATGSAHPRERSRLDAFAAAVADARLGVYVGLAIPQLAALLERCALHVGPDSGVLHLALASGVRTVALFRDYPGAPEWLPRGPQHQHFLLPCDCLGQKHPPCLERGVAACLARLSPDTVAAAILEPGR